jgi:O-antigen ligase
MPGLSVFSAPVALLAGKDGSLTGRTAIWELIRDHIARRPVFGSGYGAYWEPNRGAGTESAIFVKQLDGFYPGSSHNGYLEVTNDLGACGLLLLCGYLITHVREGVRCSAQDWAQGLLCLTLWLQQALTNFSESHWFNVTSVDFVFLSVATFTLARQRVQREFLAVHGPLPVVSQ